MILIGCKMRLKYQEAKSTLPIPNTGEMFMARPIELVQSLGYACFNLAVVATVCVAFLPGTMQALNMTTGS